MRLTRALARCDRQSSTSTTAALQPIAAPDPLANAAQVFRESLGTADGSLHPSRFPFDACRGAQPVGDIFDRLPQLVRRSDLFRKMLLLPDAAVNERDPRERVTRGDLLEALAGWQFARETHLNAATVERPSAGIDYAAESPSGTRVLFDPFLSPIAAPGRQPRPDAERRWAAPGGAYDRHTHAKGGDASTIGVWDQTFTSESQRERLLDLLDEEGVTAHARVASIRVPLPELYAAEHLAAEAQIARDARNAAAMSSWFDHVETELVAECGQGADLWAVLDGIEHQDAAIRQRAREWRTRLAQNAAWARALCEPAPTHSNDHATAAA